jgi:hypothetical protein
MYKSSDKSTPPTLFGGLSQQFSGAKGKDFDRINAWHNIFRDEVTGKIDESVFSVLYFKDNGRPNSPLRILVAMMILKEGHGWSDEKLCEETRFNLMVMNALGLSNVDDEAPSLSTYYAFRAKVMDYSTSTGIDLMGLCFDGLTRGQCKLFGPDGSKLRMDSKLVGSNIAKCSRLRLVLGCLQKFYKGMGPGARGRMCEEDREFFEKLGSRKPGHVVYSLNIEEKTATLVHCGGLIMRLLEEIGEVVTDNDRMLARLFEDQFCVIGGEVVAREPKEIESGSLQSPFDPDAAYRDKGDQKVQGFGVNVAETCSKEKGKVDLITAIQVEGANFPDNEFLVEAVEKSEAVAGEVKEVSSDGAYHSQENDDYADLNEMEVHYTGFQGVKGRFEFEYGDRDVLVRDTRTGEVMVALETKEGTYRITLHDTGKPVHRYFDQPEIDCYFKRKKVEEMPVELRNRRPNVEATIFQLSFLTRNGKTRYRGKFKTMLWALGRAMWINFRRIAIHLGAACPDGPKTAVGDGLLGRLAALLCIIKQVVAIFAKTWARWGRFSSLRRKESSNYELSSKTWC